MNFQLRYVIPDNSFWSVFRINYVNKDGINDSRLIKIIKFLKSPLSSWNYYQISTKDNN